MEVTMKSLLILGIGGQGRSVLDCALSQEAYTEIAFLADDIGINQIAGHTVYQEREFQKEGVVPLTFLQKFDEVIIAEGNNKVRLDKAKLFLDNGIKLAALIHPHATVSRLAKIGVGTVVFANAVVNSFTNIGIACIINTGAIVEHDCTIYDGVHISPGAVVAGTVIVGERSWICIGGNVANNLSIGANSIVGAGSAVLENIPDNVLVAGIPAKIKKYF
jgi:sugar O-acyltransferase (sialic acid O-acetyltransferase NeuD family)